MRRVLALALLLLLATPAWAQAPAFRVGFHITSATTTTLLTGVTGQKIVIQGGSICVDAGATATNITIQDSTPTNLVGTGVVYALAAGQCLIFPRVQDLYYVPTAAGASLQLVTSAAGPVEVYLELVQR